MIRARATEYLKNLHGLELMAGLNFRVVRDDLAARGLLSAGIRERLDIAFRQEVRHAVQVRRMLKALGFEGKRELTEIMFWLNDVLAQTLEAFPADQRPYIRILLNHVIEQKLARHGNRETFDAMCETSQVMPTLWEQVAVRSAAQEFYETVAREEPDHVELDEEVMRLYAPIFPDLDANAAMRAIRARGTPFYRAIRVKREFIRAAHQAAAAEEAA